MPKVFTLEEEKNWPIHHIQGVAHIDVVRLHVDIKRVTGYHSLYTLLPFFCGFSTYIITYHVST